jgi:acyl-coenzyme A synthetase/AMP-(fatty) acid ligase
MNDGSDRSGVAESIYAQFLRIVAASPERPALEDSETWTYRQLNATALHIAASIEAAGIDPARPLLVLGPNGAGTTAMVLAVLAAGRVAGVLPWAQPPQQQAALIKKLNGGLLCTPEDAQRHRALLDDIDAPVLLCDASRRADASPYVPCRASAQDPALLVFTSGSTGISKAILQSHRTALWNVETLNEALVDSHALWQSMTYGSAMQTMMRTLLSGATGWFFDVKTHGLAHFAEWLSERSIEQINLPVGLFRDYLTLLESGAARATIKAIKVGGILYRRDIDRAMQVLPPAVVISTGYATSETSTLTRALWARDTALPDDAEPLPAGPPIRGVQLFIRDENGRDVPTGEKGRIYVRKEAMALGYYGDAAATAARFRVVDDAGTHEYDTGDLGSLDERGWLRVYGRIDDVVKIRGLRIELSAVDAALEALPSVRAARAYACMSAGSEVLGATLVLQADAQLDMSTLRSALLQQLPDYMAPTDVRIAADLPKTTTGKIDRRATAELHAGRGWLPDQLQAVRAELHDDVERALAKIWEESLGRPVNDRTADFFALGGHSFAAMRVAAQIEKRWAVRKTITELFAHPTLSDQAGLIRRQDEDGHRHEAGSPLRMLRAAGDEQPVLFISNASRPVEMAMPLVSALPPEWRVYGMQPPGIEAGTEPLATIEEEADLYLREVLDAGIRCRAVIAVCGGSIAALELMHRWPTNESEPPLLVLLDPSAASLKRTSGAPNSLQRSAVLRHLRNRQYSKLYSMLVELAKLTVFRRYYPQLPRWRRVMEHAREVRAKHTPRPYAGAVLHFVSAESERAVGDAEAWRALCVGDYERHVLPHTNHRSFYSGGPAQQVSAHIVRALAARGR